MSNNVDAEEIVKRKPGRPKKAENEAKQPRQIFYVVTGLHEATSCVQTEEFSSPLGASEEELKKYTPEFVKTSFEEKGWTVALSGIYGPFHKVKGLIKQIKPQSSSVAKDTEFGNLLGEAEYDGWLGAVFAVKNRTDVVCFVPTKQTTSKFLSKEIALVPKININLNTNNESNDVASNQEVDLANNDLFE